MKYSSTLMVVFFLAANTLISQPLQNKADTQYYYPTSSYGNNAAISPIRSITIRQGNQTKITSYFRNGLKSGIVQKVNDTLYGKQESWYNSGLKRESAIYKKGQVLSRTRWFETGTIKSKENFIYTYGAWDNPRQMRHGIYLKNYRNGQTQKKGSYDSGKYYGAWFSYYESGILSSKVNYKHNQLDGKAMYWYQSGQLKNIANYKVIRNPNWTERKPNTINSPQRNNYNIREWIQTRDGKQVSYYESGKKREESFFKNGKRHGAFKKWLITGKLVSYIEYKEGYINGKNYKYYANGSPQQILKQYFHKKGNNDSKYWRNGQYYEGKYETYFRNGMPQVKAFYKKKKLQGKYLRFYQNGSKYQESFHKNGLKYGASKSWYQNGMLKAVTNYKITRMDGDLISVRHGAELKYTSNRTLSLKGKFENGQRVGLWQAWHPNGQLKSETNYCDGEPCQTLKQWNTRGELITEKRYSTGNDSKPYLIEDKRFNESGLKSHQFYDSKGRQSRSLYYFENGKIMRMNYFLTQSGPYAALRINRRLSFYSNGNLKSDLFDAGQFIGTRLEYYFDGSPKSLSNFSYMDREDNFIIIWDPAGHLISYQKSMGDDRKINDPTKASVLYQIAQRNSTQKYQSTTGATFDLNTNYNSLVDIKKREEFTDYTVKYWDGKPCLKMSYKNAETHGKFELWSSKGILIQTGDYKDGYNSGLWIHRNHEGVRTADYNYYSKDSVYARMYFANQNIRTEYMLEGRYKNGSYKKYYENGNLYSSTTYVRNKIHGVYESFHKNGKKQSQYTAKRGQKHGLSEQWYENGQKRSRSFYNQGRIDSTYNEWWDNGQVSARGKYFNRSKKIGVWTFYKKDGSLLGGAEYNNSGRLVGSYLNNSCFCVNKPMLEIPLTAKPWQNFPYRSQLYNLNKSYKLRYESSYSRRPHFSDYSEVKDGNSITSKFNLYLSQKIQITNRYSKTNPYTFNSCYSIFDKVVTIPAEYKQTNAENQLTLFAKTVEMSFNKRLLTPLDKETNERLNIYKIDHKLRISTAQLNVDGVVFKKDSIRLINPSNFCFTPSIIGTSKIKVRAFNGQINSNYLNEAALTYYTQKQLEGLTAKDRFTYYTQRVRAADQFTGLGYEVRMNDANFELPARYFDTAASPKDTINFEGLLTIYDNGLCGALKIQAKKISDKQFELEINGKKIIVEIDDFIKRFNLIHRVKSKYSYNPSSKNLLILFSI